MTYKSLLKKAEKKIETTELETEAAKWLLMHVSNLTPSQFYLAFDQEVDAKIEALFLEGIERYMAYTPIQHIIGYQTFYGYDFIVNEDVLIPRKETEELVEQVLYYYDDHYQGKKIDVCDIGTGSGCIAITLAKEEKNLNVVAADISEKALAVAQKNNEKLKANVRFYAGDLLSPLKGMKFDIIVSNPPYIPNQEDVANIVKTNEPNIALFGGDTGMIFYERILKDSKNYLKDKGLIAFEHAYDKREAMYALAKFYYPKANIIQLKDLSGKDRMTLIEVNAHDA